MSCKELGQKSSKGCAFKTGITAEGCDSDKYMISHKTCPASSSPRGISKTPCAVWNRTNCCTIATQGYGVHIAMAVVFMLYTGQNKAQGPRDSSGLSENATCSRSIGKSACQESVQFHAETSHQAGFGPDLCCFSMPDDSSGYEFCFQSRFVIIHRVIARWSEF